MSGKTDPQILGEIAARTGIAERDRPAVVAEALGHLGTLFDGLALRFAAEGRVLPGVPEVLRRLHDRGDVLQTLLTGNIAANGRAKVAAFGLDRWLVPEAGAYGSDDPDRERLVPLALQRASAYAGRPFAPSEVWVVGDTPRDLACARAGGVRCCLVATGRYGSDELEGLGADAALPDLSNTPAVLSLLAS
jgi:phosphoglycolate phosphatase